MDLFTAERAALRAQIKERRAALNREEIESLSAHLTTRALAHPYLQTQQCVASFVSFGQEVETRNLNLELKRRGHLLALPVISETEKGLVILPFADMQAAYAYVRDSQLSAYTWLSSSQEKVNAVTEADGKEKLQAVYDMCVATPTK